MSGLISRTYKLTQEHIDMLVGMASRNERSMSAQLRFLIADAFAREKLQEVARMWAAGQVTDAEADEALERVGL